jgi:hypothetical protein
MPHLYAIQAVDSVENSYTLVDIALTVVSNPLGPILADCERCGVTRVDNFAGGTSTTDVGGAPLPCTQYIDSNDNNDCPSLSCHTHASAHKGDNDSLLCSKFSLAAHL